MTATVIILPVIRVKRPGAAGETHAVTATIDAKSYRALQKRAEEWNCTVEFAAACILSEFLKKKAR